jgi:hypothetical protein
VSAYAETYEDAGDAEAVVTLDAEGDIEITDGGYLIAEAGTDDYSGSAKAAIDIDARGNVLIDADDDLEDDAIYATAWSYNGDEAVADIDITAGGNLTAQNGSGVMADAYSEGNSGDSTANIDIVTGGDVTVSNNSRLEAYVWSPVDSEDPIAGNTIAGVKIDAGGEVLVKNDSEIIADAEAEETSTTAYVDIDAVGDVTVLDSDSEITANSSTNYYYAVGSSASDASVDIQSSANVLINGLVEAYATVYESDYFYPEVTTTANADVVVNALDGDVIVHSEGTYAAIAAEATGGDDNVATVKVDAVGGDVVVEDTGISPRTAEIAAYAHDATNSNTADVQVTATATTSEYEEEGLTYVDVYGGNVEVIAQNGGHAEISAVAEHAITTNTANVTIRTTSAEGTKWEPVIEDGPYDTLEPLDLAYEAVNYTEGGDVTVEVQNGGEAVIKAETRNADENDSDVLICAEGQVLVSDENSQDTTAKIESVANFGNINNAYTGISGAEGIEISANNGNASIASKAMYGLYEGFAEQNTAFTSLCTDGDVLVIGENFGTSEVLALAYRGFVNTADTGVCADGDVLVAAGLATDNGTDKIRSKAEADLYSYEVPVDDFYTYDYPEPYYEMVNTTSTAKTTVISHNGGVGVIDKKYEGVFATASIEAEAYYSGQNNAYVGVAAGADLSPGDLVEPVGNGPVELSPVEQWLENLLPGNVHVEGHGSTAEAYIRSQADDGYENIAETVVAAPGKVELYTEDGKARIMAVALNADDIDDNTATARVYAGDVFVSDGAYIMSHVDGPPLFVGGASEWSLGEPIPEWEGDGEATLIIQDYDERTDLPVAPPCPDCDIIIPPDEPPIGPPIGPPAPLGTAPIPTIEEINFGQGGCPALMAWLANEVGVQVDIQVFLAGAFISSTDCQPCESAAKLRRAATVLADEEGSYMAAMNQVFNATVPFTPEAAASITTDTGAQYALVREYIDAFVQYIAFLNDEMGSPIGDSVAYVMEKYGSGITGSGNEDMATFVASRLESGETYTPAQ